jgi:uncharacterized protein (TIGR04255 family)
LDLVINAFKEFYNPVYSSRVGLRFINRFTLKNTRKKSLRQVIGLFNPALTTLLRNKCLSEATEMLGQLILPDNGAKLSLRTNYTSEKDEPYFLLDFDYYEEGEIEFTNLIEKINHYHNVIYDAFRWCVKDECLNYFEPIQE